MHALAFIDRDVRHTSRPHHHTHNTHTLTVSATMLPRRKRSAAERRAQRQRAAARHLGWALKACDQLVAHRGCAGAHQLDWLVEQLRGGHKWAVSERIVKQTVDNPKPAVDAPVPQAMEGIVEVDVASAPAFTLCSALHSE